MLSLSTLPRIIFYPVDPATNRISNGNAGSAGMYDANGNITGAPGATLSYDVANRVVAANVNGALEQYGYSADNHRIMRQRTNGTVEYVLYGARGERLGIYTLGTNPRDGATPMMYVSKVSVWFGGRLLVESTGSEQQGVAAPRVTNRTALVMTTIFGQYSTLLVALGVADVYQL